MIRTKFLGICLSCIILVGFSFPVNPQVLSIVSVPTRLHFELDAYCSIGKLDHHAFANEEFPQFSSFPRFKVALVPVATDTRLNGTNLKRLVNVKDFADYISFHAPNLKLVQLGESYTYYQNGQPVNTGKLYNALTVSSDDPKSIRERIEATLSNKKVNWTMPAAERSYYDVKVFASPDPPFSVGELASDKKGLASGAFLDQLSQGYFPESGFARENVKFNTCQPYTVVPVIVAQDNFLDFMFRPIGTVFEEVGGEYVQKPSSESACAIKSIFHDIVFDQTSSSMGFDGVMDMTINTKLRYKNEFRFDYSVDPPEIAGLSALPLATSNNGVSSMFEQSGKNHLIQGFMSLGKLYRWMPQTDPAYPNQKLLIKPAVRDRVLAEGTYWELSKFRVHFSDAALVDGKVEITERFVDISPIKFDEISQGRFAYFTFTNNPLLEGVDSTFFIEKIDRPFRIEAVYEPGRLGARGKENVAESTRLKLFWSATPQMKDLAKRKIQEYGENWWKKAFPTHYKIVVKGPDGQKTFDKINPVQESMVVEGLKPGAEYSWELQTWVSDAEGSPQLVETWKSDFVKTRPLPLLVGHCGQTSIIKVKTVVDADGDEVWVISAPMAYELGMTKLQPLYFMARPTSFGQFEKLLKSKSYYTVVEKDGQNYLRAYIKVTAFSDSYEKDDHGRNIIHLEFQPVEVRVDGEAVDEFMQPIGKSLGGHSGTWWPARDGPSTSSLRVVEAPLLVKTNKFYRFRKWTWVGPVYALRSPIEDAEKGVAVLFANVDGCQANPDKYVKPKIYAVYDTVPVDCFTVTSDFAINWKPVAYSGKIPIKPEGDCPGNSSAYMAGTQVSIGPAPKEIVIGELKYKFVGWIIGENSIPGKEVLTINVDKSYNVLANYQPASDRYELFFLADADGRRIDLRLSINPPPDKDGLYKAGTVVTVGPAPLELDDGKYSFAGWALDGDIVGTDFRTNSIQVTMDKNHRLICLYKLGG